VTISASLNSTQEVGSQGNRIYPKRAKQSPDYGKKLVSVSVPWEQLNISPELRPMFPPSVQNALDAVGPLVIKRNAEYIRAPWHLSTFQGEVSQCKWWQWGHLKGWTDAEMGCACPTISYSARIKPWIEDCSIHWASIHYHLVNNLPIVVWHELLLHRALFWPCAALRSTQSISTAM
jgi:hypothetical protein